MSNPPDHLNPTILALERTIAGLEQQIEKLKEERDQCEVCAAKQAVDELLKIAEDLRDAANGFVPPDLPEAIDALDKWKKDRLTRSAKAKGGGE